MNPTAPNLEAIAAAIDNIASALSKTALLPSADVLPYEQRELTAAEIDPATADGAQVQRDGSTWTTSKGENGPAGTIFQTMYGYISPKKDPVMWAKMAAAFNDEAWLVTVLAANGPYARYKMHPNAVLYMRPNEAFMLLSQCFAAATSQTHPTV